MKIKRNTDVFEFDLIQYGRGQWGFTLIRVNGELLWQPPQSDPEWTNERDLRRHLRDTIGAWRYTNQFGWTA